MRHDLDTEPEDWTSIEDVDDDEFAGAFAALCVLAIQRLGYSHAAAILNGETGDIHAPTLN